MYTIILYKKLNEDNIKLIEWIECKDNDELGKGLEQLFQLGKLVKQRRITHSKVYVAQVLQPIEIH